MKKVCACWEIKHSILPYSLLLLEALLVSVLATSGDLDVIHAAITKCTVIGCARNF